MIQIFRGVKKISVYMAAVLLFGSVAGCGASSVEVITESPMQVSVQAPSETIEINYVAPVQIPGIFVDQIGYKKDAEKTIVLKGENLPEEFAVIEAETGREVYKGTVQPNLKAADEEGNCALGRFTDFKDEGTYYIFSENLGESYSFSIGDEGYRELFQKACKKFYINRCGFSLSEKYAEGSAHSACHTTAARLQENSSKQLDVTGGWHMDEQADRDAALGCRIAENLLVAYEMNKESFDDNCEISESGNGIPDILDEVKYEADWLLKMQDSETGGVYGAALTGNSQGTDVFMAPVIVAPVSMDATIAFASMMARFSYIYQQFDSEYATGCLKAADRAWNFFLTSQDPAQNSAAFKAATELYRATGTASYSEVLESYFSKSSFYDSLNTDENIFLGAITYLSTSQPVDMERCAVLIKAIMKKAELIAKASSEDAFMVTDRADEGFGKILEDMRSMAIVNHFIYNHEYTTIIENHVHYMLGMNPGALNYVSDNTERTYVDTGDAGIMNDPSTDAMLVLVLGAIQ